MGRSNANILIIFLTHPLSLTVGFSCRGSHITHEFLVNPVAELRDNLEMSELSQAHNPLLTGLYNSIHYL